MDINVSDLIAKLKAMDRRLLALVIAGIFLFGYFTVVGAQYLGEVSRYNDMLAQQQDMFRTISLASRAGVDTPQAELAAIERELAATAEQFSYDHLDYVLPKVADVARRSGVEMTNISSTASGKTTVSGIEYQVQKVGVSVRGSLMSIYGFIENLSESSPLRPLTINISGLPNSPSAQISVEMLVNPKITPPTSGGEA